MAMQVTRIGVAREAPRAFLTKVLLAAAMAMPVFAPQPGWADPDRDGEEAGAGTPHFPFGAPGHLNDVDVTIDVEAGDVFFAPATFEVKAGQTIRMVITNTGTVVHEFTLGSAAVQEVHRAEMMDMMNMGVFDAVFMNHAAAHHDWNAILLNPGERRVMVWTFDQPGTVEFGCNVPGHYEAGMHGTIEIRQ